MTFTCTRRFAIGWGDCAPSAAVYYPNYFRWFDQAVWDLFAAAGLPLQELERRHGNVGLPVAKIETAFLAPCRLHDVVSLETSIVDWPPKRVVVRHRLRRDATELVLATETRFWGVRHSEDPRRLASVEVPAEVRAHFDRLGAAGEPARAGR